jgi:hypothetical protein
VASTRSAKNWSITDPGNPSINFRGERRSNDTHQSTTDPKARLAKKTRGIQAHVAYTSHALMENRYGLLVDFQLSQATSSAERDAVPRLIDQARARGFRPRTLAAVKGYDTKACVAELRQRQVTPHVTQNTSGRRSAIDGRSTRRVGYAISQRKWKLVEEIFGWMKTVGGFRRTRYRAGTDATGRLLRGCGIQPGPPGQAATCRAAQLALREPPRPTRPITGAHLPASS